MHIRAPLWVLCLGLTGCGASVRITPRERLRQSGEAVVQVIQPTIAHDGSVRLGTGLVVDPRGYVVTNFHVVDQRPRNDSLPGSGRYLVCTIDAEGRTCHPATLVATEPLSDLALLRADGRAFDRYVSFADDDAVAPGDRIYLWGNVSSLAPPSPMHGYVLNRMEPAYLHADRVEMGPTSQDVVMLPVLLLDMSSQSGSSGGPVFDADGRCIAVLFGAIRIGTINNALDMAIPSSRVVLFLRKHLPTS